MPTMLYCWRCQARVPMLTEAEAADVFPNMATYRAELHAELERTGLDTAGLFATGWLPKVLSEYKRITGVHERNVNAIWHHVASLYGPPCRYCGEVLRTRQAKFCFLCHRSQADEYSSGPIGSTNPRGEA